MARTAPLEATNRNALEDGYSPAGAGEVRADTAAFNGLLQQLDELLAAERQTWQASDPPAAIPAQPGPREPKLPREQRQLPPPPAAIPQPRTPRRQEQGWGRHALDHNQAPDGRLVRPVVQRATSHRPSGRHAARHAAEPSAEPYTARHAASSQEELAAVLPFPKQVTVSAPTKPEAKKPTGRWRAIVAGVSAVALAGAGAATATDSGREMFYRVLGAETVTGAPAAVLKGVPGRSITDIQPPLAFQHPSASATPRLVAPAQAPKAVREYTAALERIPKKQLQGVCASLLLAQAVVLSNQGASKAARQFNNPFGIRNSKGDLVRYASLDKGIAAQARRITASHYYHDSRFFPGQALDSCAPNSRTVLLGADAKTVRMNLIFSYFTQRSLPSYQIAGMIGNFERESGINPATVQKYGGSARGLAQWEKSRWLSLKRFMAKKKLPWHDLYGQLQFLDYEFGKSERSAYRALRATKTVNGATDAFAYKFERPNRTPKKIRMDIRRTAAQRAQAHQVTQRAAVQESQRLIASYQLAKT